VLDVRFDQLEYERLRSTAILTGATHRYILHGLIISAIKESRISTIYSGVLPATINRSSTKIGLTRSIEKQWRDLCDAEGISPGLAVRCLVRASPFVCGKLPVIPFVL
jgi:hypothetical protein